MCTTHSARDLPLALMPKGVEHSTEAKLKAAIATLPLALMPKGVEHSEGAGAIAGFEGDCPSR